jgi:hypothetical protein
VAICAVTGGYMDDYPVDDAKRFVEEFATYLETRNPEVFAAIRESGDMSEEIEASLKAALESFQEVFTPTGAAPDESGSVGGATAPDEVKPDVGWDRMSSVDDEPPSDDPDTPPA